MNLLFLSLMLAVGPFEGGCDRLGVRASLGDSVRYEAAAGTDYAALRLRQPLGEGSVEAEHLWRGPREYVTVRLSAPAGDGWTYTQEDRVTRDRVTGRPEFREAFYLTWEKDRLLARVGVTNDLREAGVVLLARW